MSHVHVYVMHGRCTYRCTRIKRWPFSAADYIGCMKNGPVYTDRKYHWFERQWPLLGDKYFTHAWGTLYVLSGRIAAQIGSIPDGSLRFFSNEGVLALLLTGTGLDLSQDDCPHECVPCTSDAKGL